MQSSTVKRLLERLLLEHSYEKLTTLKGGWAQAKAMLKTLLKKHTEVEGILERYTHEMLSLTYGGEVSTENSASKSQSNPRKPPKVVTFH